MTLATDTRPATKRSKKIRTPGGAPQITTIMHRAGQAVDARMFEALDEIDMTPRQYALLRAVFIAADQTQSMLVTRTGIDRSTLADLVRRLVKRGWLRRTRNPADTREWNVRLTADGAALYAQAKELADKVDRDIARLVGGQVYAVNLQLALEEIITGEAA